MSNYETQSPKPFPEENKNLLSDGLRIFGLVLMSTVIGLALLLIAWVLWNRKSRVVAMMQPVFLIMLCVGTIITVSAIMPMGADDENTDNIDAACLSYYWLITMGSTISLSALFSKLSRVNQIFHAQGFQRKVVTAKDVLRPFLIIFGFNLALLIILSLKDPPVWQRGPVDERYPYSTFGQCTPEGILGIFIIFLITIVDFGALAFLCVQAYRARDIRSDFSEARGVALALFSNLQIVIIGLPTDFLIHKENADAKHMLSVMSTFVSGMSMMLFIFGPLIAHHRQHVRGGPSATDGSSNTGTRTHISGLNFDAPSGGPTGAAVAPSPVAATTTSSTDHNSNWKDEESQTVTGLELEVETLSARIKELEGATKKADESS